MRVIVVDSDERRSYEEDMRQKSMERTRAHLEKLQKRVAAGKLKQPEKIGAAAERALQRNHGYRYYSWDIHQGSFRYFENAEGLKRENGIEGKYVIATSEAALSVLEVVAIYKDLSDVEQGFRQLKDVLAVRPDLSSGRDTCKSTYIRSRIGPVGPAVTSSAAGTSGD